MSQELASGPGQAPEPKISNRLHWRDDEAIQWFAAEGQDLVQKSPLGGQLGAMRDEMGPAIRTEAEQPWQMLTELSHNRAPLGRARSMWQILRHADQLERGSSAVLLTYCHPIALLCDGIQDPDDRMADGKMRVVGRLPGGRLLALFPLTDTARQALSIRVMKREGGGKICEWPRRRLVPRGGMTPYDALRQMSQERERPKSDHDRECWIRMRCEAEGLLTRSIVAFNVSKRVLGEAETFKRDGRAA